MKKIFGAFVGVMMATSAMAADLYVTGSVGTAVTGRGDTTVGLTVGNEFNKNLRVEGAYAYDVDNKENTLFAHVIPQAYIPGTSLTPYVLVGVGVNFDELDNRPLWALGAGVRVGVTKSVDLDLRYRVTDTMNTNDRREHVSVGLSYNF